MIQILEKFDFAQGGVFLLDLNGQRKVVSVQLSPEASPDRMQNMLLAAEKTNALFATHAEAARATKLPTSKPVHPFKSSDDNAGEVLHYQLLNKDVKRLNIICDDWGSFVEALTRLGLSKRDFLDVANPAYQPDLGMRKISGAVPLLLDTLASDKLDIMPDPNIVHDTAHPEYAAIKRLLSPSMRILITRAEKYRVPVGESFEQNFINSPSGRYFMPNDPTVIEYAGAPVDIGDGRIVTPSNIVLITKDEKESAEKNIFTAFLFTTADIRSAPFSLMPYCAVIEPRDDFSNYEAKFEAVIPATIMDRNKFIKDDAAFFMHIVGHGLEIINAPGAQYQRVYATGRRLTGLKTAGVLRKTPYCDYVQVSLPCDIRDKFVLLQNSQPTHIGISPSLHIRSAHLRARPFKPEEGKVILVRETEVGNPLSGIKGTQRIAKPSPDLK